MDILEKLDKLILITRLHELDRTKDYINSKYYWQRRNELINNYQNLKDHANQQKTIN
jgi:hypothetical protein